MHCIASVEFPHLYGEVLYTGPQVHVHVFESKCIYIRPCPGRKVLDKYGTMYYNSYYGTVPPFLPPRSTLYTFCIIIKN